MSWSKQNFPAAMSGLSPAERAQAIDIANALLDKGMADGLAIRIAVNRVERTTTRWHQRLNTAIELNKFGVR